MKLLFVTANSAQDRNLWSGLVWSMRQALLGAGCEVEVFDQIPFECPPHLRLLHQAYRRLGRRTHQIQLEPAVLRRAAHRIETRFAAGNYDAVFSPGTGVPVYAHVRPDIPVFSFLDASKLGWIRAYFGLDSLCARSRRHAAAVDRLSLALNTLTFVASDWAKAEIASDYPGLEARVRVMPFGANLAAPPSASEIAHQIAHRPRDRLRLFFLGKDWERKGGPRALALVHALRALDVPATLELVGCAPALSPRDSAVARIHGFIDRSQPEGEACFRALLSQAHFLLFLSQAEAFGIAPGECAAFGVPTLATRVGGIPTAVRDGYSAILIPPEENPAITADRLAALWSDPAGYARLAAQARLDYEERLNWAVLGRRMRAEMTRALQT